MLTPQEKAQELIQFYRFGDNIVYNWTTDKKELIGANNRYYKECALKVINEVIEVAYWNSVKEYWKEVKQEIEKI